MPIYVNYIFSKPIEFIYPSIIIFLVFLVLFFYKLTHKISYDANADTLKIISRRVCTNFIPSTAFVHVTIFAYNEIITKVEPTTIVDMQILIRSDYLAAGFLIVTILTNSTMVDHDIRRWCTFELLLAQRFTSFPFLSSDNPWTTCRGHI